MCFKNDVDCLLGDRMTIENFEKCLLKVQLGGDFR